MYRRGGGPSRSSECALLYGAGRWTDDGLAKEPTLKEPIPIYLVSHEFSLDDRVKHVRTLLGSTKEEQESAKSLEPTNASKFIDLLDQVRFLCSFTIANALTGNRS